MVVTSETFTASRTPQSEDVLFDAFLLIPSLLRLMHRLRSSRFRFGLLPLLLAGTILSPPVHAQSSDAPTGTLTVRVDGLTSDEGTVQIALNDEQNYDDGNLRAAALPIQDGTARWTIDGVPHGTYAVRLYHDEDGDGELDTNMFGAPQEAFGFSNDRRGSMGPPDFDEAAFTLESDSLLMTITAE